MESERERPTTRSLGSAGGGRAKDPVEQPQAQHLPAGLHGQRQRGSMPAARAAPQPWQHSAAPAGARLPGRAEPAAAPASAA